MNLQLPKVIIILGPTASGKTDLAIQLATEFNGEIISADSRQVYKQLNIATAKPNGKWQMVKGEPQFLVKGIPHYLIDTHDPRHVFSAAEFKDAALAAITKITARGKLPFVVGGTGLYIWSLIDNLSLANAPPDTQWRQGVAQLNLPELVAELTERNAQFAAVTDLKNRRRVERSLEISYAGGKKSRGPALVNALMLGVRWPPSELRARIRQRLAEHLQSGLIEETRSLLASGLSFDLPALSGIGYKEVVAYLYGQATLAETTKQLETNTWRYAKRQVTWFKRDKRIVWLDGSDLARARILIKDFFR